MTRNLPLAVQREPSWDEVAVGTEQSAVVDVALDDDGRVADWKLEPLERGEHPRRMKELARRAVALLVRGQYAIGGRFGALQQRVRISVRVAESEAHDEDFVDPGELYSQGSEPPANGRPGKAFLRRNSGRMLVMKLELL